MVDDDDNSSKIVTSYVYILVLTPTPSHTYVGYTNNLERRLRQHNGTIKGGAVYTTSKLRQGTWERICYVENFPDATAALQFEWRLKQISRRDSSSKPVEKRLNALKKLLSLGRPTTKSLPYEEWAIQPNIVWLNDSYRNMYDANNNT